MKFRNLLRNVFFAITTLRSRTRLAGSVRPGAEHAIKGSKGERHDPEYSRTIEK